MRSGRRQRERGTGGRAGMRIVLDTDLSPKIVQRLTEAGHDLPGRHRRGASLLPFPRRCLGH